MNILQLIQDVTYYGGMHNFLGLGKRQKLVLLFVCVVLIFAGVFVFINNKNGEEEGQTVLVPPEEETSFVIDEKPTDFVRVGTVVFNNPGLPPGVPYLVYEEPGKPALTKEIVFDGLSICSASNGATPCIAMSVTLDIPFGGKRAVVEGINQGENVVLLRKMTIVEDGEEPRFNAPGSIFISWPHAVSLIELCAVSEISQTHALDVHLTLKEDGRRVRAVEPVIDEVFRIFPTISSICPNILIGTE